MKRKLKLKKEVKVILLGIVFITGFCFLLKIQDNKNYTNALKRCGSNENIITTYTQQGDRYYVCK